MPELFDRYWDSEEKAELYNRKVEGDDFFGRYNHESEVYGLVRHYDPRKLDVVLDAGCGNGRFVETLPATATKIGLDASLNLLRLSKERHPADFLVCGELEHLPFKDGVFGTVISCGVLQHLREQEKAVREMSRVLRDGGDLILELYNTWNPKTVYKNIRMSPRLRRVFNAPFRLLFRSMSPFESWGIEYDNYNNWFETKAWMRNAQLTDIEGRGVGFGYHKYLFDPFFIMVILTRKAPHFFQGYLRACLSVEKVIGHLIPLRYFMEKFVIKGTKQESALLERIAVRARRKLRHWYKAGGFYNRHAWEEVRRERQGSETLVGANRSHLSEAVNWMMRAQDSSLDRGVARGFSVGWTPS